MNQEVACNNGLKDTDCFQLAEDERRRLSINDDILDAIRDVFCEMDEDGNGVLSTSELGDAMTALGVSYADEELTGVMHEIDKNGDGTIDFSEFVQMISSKMKLNDPDQELRNAFDVFDADRDGSITTEELRTAVESLGEHLSEEDIDQMMAEADENHDGHVDFAEFCKIWTGEAKDTDREPQSTTASSQSSTSPLTVDTCLKQKDKNDKDNHIFKAANR